MTIIIYGNIKMLFGMHTLNTANLISALKPFKGFQLRVRTTTKLESENLKYFLIGILNMKDRVFIISV